MTVDQYRDLPENDSVIQELHWGQVVELTRPKMKHARLQARLGYLLRPVAEHLGIVESEVAFRALPEYDLRAADVAFVSQKRWDETDEEDNLHGSPELVIEVMSRSNSEPKMNEMATLCLTTGTQEFWVVYPNKKKVTVISGQNSTDYTMGQNIPLTLFGGFLPVSEIFSNKPSAE